MQMSGSNEQLAMSNDGDNERSLLFEISQIIQKFSYFGVDFSCQLWYIFYREERQPSLLLIAIRAYESFFNPRNSMKHNKKITFHSKWCFVSNKKAIGGMRLGC